MNDGTEHQSSTMIDDSGIDREEDKCRSYCKGIVPLSARMEKWMTDLCEDDKALSRLVERFGSPLNLVNPKTFERNVDRFRESASRHDIDFEVYFARKANKCLAFVNAAHELKCGVDTASLQECEQVISSGLPADKVICTAAIKTDELVRFCVAHEVVMAIDNPCELEIVSREAMANGKQVNIALRVGGFKFGGEHLKTRFGFDVNELIPFIESNAAFNANNCPLVVGLHFHLDGYCHQQRVAAIQQCLPLIDELRNHGHPIKFLDMGGGIPMSYLDDARQWDLFWLEHELAILGQREPVTYLNHGLGLLNVDGKVAGVRKSYPFFQPLVQTDWLESIFSSPFDSGTIAEAIRSRRLQLRCEPGRSILDGSGMTVARVEFCKQHRDGHWLVGLAMNHTQCRTSSVDFMVDPIVVKVADDDGESSGRQQSTGPEAEGFLVGAYCTESELIFKRRMRFPKGVTRGDLVIIPNTAGYFMHFLESRSHQFPLAKNVVVDQGSNISFSLDNIEHSELCEGK
ncbi:Y4yA family PLP-dependent enzyme [Mariniblastus sp.]|nr:Y4yA family PLP-dependent enzyme [Mariniblastus sp.]